MPRKLKTPQKPRGRPRKTHRSPKRGVLKRRKSSPPPSRRTKKVKTTRCFRRSKSKIPLVNRNLAKYVKEVNDEPKTCQVMTPHGHIIDLPDKYPGDDFVFENLYSNPEENMELVESELLREVYNKYHRMCF